MDMDVWDYWNNWPKKWKSCGIVDQIVSLVLGTLSVITVDRRLDGFPWHNQD